MSVNVKIAELLIYDVPLFIKCRFSNNGFEFKCRVFRNDKSSAVSKVYRFVYDAFHFSVDEHVAAVILFQKDRNAAVLFAVHSLYMKQIEVAAFCKFDTFDQHNA